ncbi:hypothetical protein TNIN_396361 [Trichonephila inaurata madagascariensis]|uniref:Uncharacterized protein n=1 Tax=Trichonephila inaurata madagascariensis TaxID=2747483 RepID=A0A8X6JVK4_9ARAC|nr:hypothetical protein TNIN_396361 [Trichonephila inaurata madagascariensis]
MIALPPEADELTDEEGFDDTETLGPSKWGIFDKNLSIDEMMIRYYGHRYFKQYIKDKGLGIRCGHYVGTMVTAIILISIVARKLSMLLLPWFFKKSPWELEL